MIFRNGRSNLLLPVSKTLQFDKFLQHFLHNIALKGDRLLLVRVYTYEPLIVFAARWAVFYYRKINDPLTDDSMSGSAGKPPIMLVVNTT